MSQITAALVGGLFDKDGTPAYSRPLLFGTTGSAVLELLPESVGTRFFIHGGSEPDIPGTQSLPVAEGNRFSALKMVPKCDHVIVIAAPFIIDNEETLRRFLDEHINTGFGVSILSKNPKGYGSEGIPIPDSDPCPAAVFSFSALNKALGTGADSLDGLIDAAVKEGEQKNVVAESWLIHIKDGGSAYTALRVITSRVNFILIEKGVHIFDPAATYISPDADIAPRVTILPGCYIRKGCKIGEGAVIGPNTILEQATIGAGTTVNSSQVYESVIGDNVTVGPFAYVRPQCAIGDNCRIGDFVELKKSTIGNNTKVSHLTYIGDATVGERVNFGCGTVVVNYDGYVKNQTIIGDDCFIGCNTNLVSPVKLGDRAFTAAGTTVTKDVPDGALAVARARQTVMEGWNDRRRAAHGQK